jgi:hypothetical protein
VLTESEHSTTLHYITWLIQQNTLIIRLGIVITEGVAIPVGIAVPVGIVLCRWLYERLFYA